MSVFEINITPTRNKPMAKTERQPTDVILAPFTPKSTVAFEDIPVSKTARRVLNIINPTDDDIKVMLTKSLNPAYNMCIEWTSSVIPSNGCKSLELVWNPTAEIQCRETIQFTDNRNFRKDVSIILKSVKKTKTGSKRFPTLSSGSTSKFTLKLKSQVPASSLTNRKATVLHASNTKTVMIQKQIQETKKYQENIKNQYIKKNEKIDIRKERAETLFNERAFKFDYETNKSPLRGMKNINKENISPLTPENASSLFDRIKFTPITEPKLIKINDSKPKSFSDLEYLASLPTPVNIKNNKNRSITTPVALSFSPEFESDASKKMFLANDALRFSKKPKEIKTYSKYNLPKIVIETESECVKILQETYDELNLISPGRTYVQDSILDASSETRKSFGVPLINNKTFDLKNQTSSYENLALLQNYDNTDASHTVGANLENSNKYQTEHVEYSVKKSTRLSSIAEMEESCRLLEPLKKIKEDSLSPRNLKRDIKLVGTPLRKCSESLRDISEKSHKTSMGAMGSMPDLQNIETLQSIEQNRYYYQQNSKSTSGLNLDNMPSKLYKNRDELNISNDSCISNAEVYFNQSEIRAASSRFNINEVKSVKKEKTGVILSSMKQEPVTPVTLNKFRRSPNMFKSPSSPNNIEYLYKRNHQEVDSPTSSNSLLHPRPSISMAVSPPKRTRFDSDYFANNVEDNSSLFRVVKWKSSQPIKKLRIQKSLSLVRKPITPRKTDEPRQMLYNTENFLQHYINPDPFAATTTLDPFLATTMYLDEESVHKYEIQFKKWLNALVSMPSELDPNCEEKVDVGTLFNEVRNKELILAPTKEEQSMNYLTKSRMEALRSAAINLFMCEEMSIICSKVAVQIKKGAIKIRADRDLHLDVVMQRNILELLLCFNPLWLRLGLEVVFGEVIHLHSNSDIIGLSTFILNRLFRDKFIERKYSKAYTLSEEYKSHMKCFTLQKIIFLLLFLDKAKKNRIIKHNPCLFVKKSQYKETREILLRISSELLATVGDITKVLRRFGYVLSHKQSYIDEFDYAFKNLAVDLRDGVRLTKIMEIILLRENLTNQLRCPAISRLQRIFNVNLALKALNEADFELKGGITAYDIVDGHREKTLSVLWQIIYKFRSPKFIAAATTLQHWWRKSWLKVVISRKIKIKEEIKRHKAASIIQAMWKGFTTRRNVNIYKQERVNATIYLQKYFRMYIARKRYITTFNSVILIQRWFRNERVAIEIRSNFLELKYATGLIQAWFRKIKLARKLAKAAPIIRQIKDKAKLEYNKAVVIQRCIKSYVVRKKFRFMIENVLDNIKKNKLEYKSAVKIQAYLKMVTIRKEFLLKKSSSKKIQQYWRSYKLSKLERLKFVEKRQATIKIQLFFRNFLIKRNIRNDYLQLRKSAILVQQLFRANQIYKIEKNNYEKLRNATILIQQRFRAMVLMKKVKNDYEHLIKVITLMQRRFRANKLCQYQLIKYRQIKESVITIQTAYRALVARRNFKSLKEKTIFIQQKFRATILARKLRMQFITLQYNAILMQQRFRANKLMKEEQLKYTKLKKAAIFIQNSFRAKSAMIKERSKFLKLRKAATFIQTRYKAVTLMKKERFNFLKLKYTTIFIQRQFRANILMKFERNEYQMLSHCVINIQHRFRANRLMIKERQKYLTVKRAAVVIQTRWRAFTEMRMQKQSYLLLKKSVIFIQQKYRAKKLMMIKNKNYTNLRKNVVYIQQLFRANRLMKEVYNNYLKVRNAVIVFQNVWRAIVQMRKVREKYLLLRKYSIVIQQRYKAKKLMQVQFKEYTIIREKVIYVQQLFRANCLMKENRTQYLKIRNATLVLQNRWRAISKMRKERNNYLLLKKSTILIQQKYRANKLMQIEQTYYENLYIAILRVQVLFKANFYMKRERSTYSKLKNSAIKIQKYFRATLEMRQQRTKYLLIKKTCETLQTHFRSRKLMLLERNNYIKTRNSVLVIQRFYRSTILMRQCRTDYLKLKNAAYIIQKRYREKKQLEFDRTKYLNMRKSAVIIQRTYRSYRQMKVEREKYSKLLNAVVTIQQKYRAKIRMRLERQKFLYLKSLIERFQVYCRGFLERKRFIAAMTPEMKLFLKQRSAAKTIQRFWRGYMVRQKWRNVRITVIREKIKELRNTTSVCNTVSYKISSAVKFLNGKRYNVQEELNVLLRLEKLSRTVPHFLMGHSNFIATFCYSIMAQAIRSEIDKQIIELCSKIILNLARYNSTTANTFQEHGLVTIAQILLRWCDKESDIFNTLCTLIWIFSHCPVKKKIIRAFMTTPEAIFMLRETKKLVLRKEKMRQNVRRLSIMPSTPTKKVSNFSPRTLPSLEPDFGIIQGKPYIFLSSVFAFDIVLENLGIKDIN